MDNSKTLHFKELLKKQDEHMEKVINGMKEARTAEQDMYSPTELSNYDNHPAELGTELFQVELNNALVVHQEHIKKEIDDALGRIDKGDYGICELCGKDIKEERLEALPYARLCIECEESKPLNLGILKKSRPVEELVLDAPMGRKYLNQQEDDEHEGMDQFYDLEKYGSSDTPQDMGGYHEYEEFYTNEVDLQGVVDPIELISNEQYKRQLPD